MIIKVDTQCGNALGENLYINGLLFKLANMKMLILDDFDQVFYVCLVLL